MGRFPAALRLTLVVIGCGIVLLFDATWGRTFGVIRLVLDVPLLFCVILAALHRWPWAIAMAAAAGLLRDAQGVTLVGAHTAALLSAVFATMVVSRRLVATRSTTSFVFSVTVGGVVAPIVWWAIVRSSAVLGANLPMPVWGQWWLYATVHAVLLPVWAMAWWGGTRQRQRLARIDGSWRAYGG